MSPTNSVVARKPEVSCYRGVSGLDTARGPRPLAALGAVENVA
jgi:hypothetical protein